MAKISHIYYRRSLIKPTGAGFKTRGVFFGTLGAAIDYIKSLKAPNTASWIFILIASSLLALSLVSCGKHPADGILLTVKADNAQVIDHREIRLFFAFSNEGIEYTPTDSTVVQVIYQQKQYKLTLPANESSEYMLPGIQVSDTTATQAVIMSTYNKQIKIFF